MLAAPAGADSPTLYVVFHRDRSLSASLANGTPVGSTANAGTPIAPGTYRVVVDNTANVDIEFDLSGPGVKLVDDLSHGEELSAAYTETFQPGSSYTYRDDNHPATVWTFATSTAGPVSGSTATTTTAGTTTTAKTTPATGGQTSTDVVGSAILRFRGSLEGDVTRAGAVAISFRGAPLSMLREGRYRITVRDDSARHGLTLQRVRRQPDVVTRPAYVGRRTATLDLRRGQWTYYAQAAKRRYFVVVG